MALTGFSVPTTLTDTRGQALPGRTLQVTGPNGYSSTITTDPATGVFRLGPLPVGDYTVSLTTGGSTRSAVVPVEATDASLQTEISNAIAAGVLADALAACEAKISRTGALTGYVPKLQGDGTLAFASPGELSSVDVTAVHKTGAEIVDGVKTFVQRPVVPDASFSLSKLVTIGTRNDSTVLFGDGTYKPVRGRTTTVTGNYTLTADDTDGHIIVDAASAVTIYLPSDAQVPLPIYTEVRVTWFGAGQPTFAGTTIASGSPGIRTQTAEQFATAASSFAVAMPTGLVDGDSILVTIMTASTAASMTWPTIAAGFVKVGPHFGPSGAGMQSFLASNIVAGNYGTAQSFAHGNSTAQRATTTTVVFSNAHATSPVDGFATSGTTTTGQPPAYTTVNPGTLEVSLKGAATATTVAGPPAPPSTLTALASTAHPAGTADQNSQLGVARGPLGGLAAGTTVGPRSWTKPDASSLYGPGMTLAVRPPTLDASTIFAAGDAKKIAARYGDATATKMGPDTWLVSGYLTA